MIFRLPDRKFKQIRRPNGQRLVVCNNQDFGSVLMVLEEPQVDGLHGDDTTLKFWTGDTGIFCNDTEVTLSGETYAGEAFSGTDTIDASDCVDVGCHPY